MKRFLIPLFCLLAAGGSGPAAAQGKIDPVGHMGTPAIDSAGSTNGITMFVTHSLTWQTVVIKNSSIADSISIDGNYPAGATILIDKRDSMANTYIRCGVEGETIQGGSVWTLAGPATVMLLKMRLDWRVYNLTLPN